jgi:hypothetical protein
MSVAPDPARLPVHRLPRRLKDKFRGASGSNQDAVWHMGQREFLVSHLAENLVLRPDPSKPTEHGFVEPAGRMPCADYQATLAATRALWSRWEGDP